MKPNTYVKIVSSGIANPVEELEAFIQGEEIMPLQEDESVEVRSSVFNEGNIIIFRNRKSREVLSVIHTPHTVYIQEQNKTISTHRPYSSFLFGMDDDGKLEPAAELFKIKIDDSFYVTASEELNDVAAWVTSVLEQITPAVIDRAIEFDRFNLPCRTNVGMEPAFALLNDALVQYTGYMLLPVKSGPGTRTAIDYFYLEAVELTGANSYTLSNKHTGSSTTFPKPVQGTSDGDSAGKVNDIQKSFNEASGPRMLTKLDRGFLKSMEVKIGEAPMVDLTMGGQRGHIPKPDANDQSTWLIDPDTKMPLHPDSPRAIKMYNEVLSQGK